MKCKKSPLKVALHPNMFCFIPLASATHNKSETILALRKINWKLSKDFCYLWKAKYIWSVFCDFCKHWPNPKPNFYTSQIWFLTIVIQVVKTTQRILFQAKAFKNRNLQKLIQTKTCLLKLRPMFLLFFHGFYRRAYTNV